MRRSILLLLALQLAAPIPGARAQEYHLRQYTVEDGLPSSYVHGVVQDSRGLIWFATRSGIAAYDGLEWTVYNQTDGLSWASQSALAWDGDGMLWSISSMPPFKIFYFDQDRWHEFWGPEDLAPELRITSFAVLGVGRRGTLAIGTSNGGLLVRHAGTWRTIGAAEGLPSDDVRGLAILDGRLIAGTSRGLAAITDGAVDAAPRIIFDESRGDLLGLTREPSSGAGGRLWLVGDGWIGHLEADRLVVVEEGLPFSSRAGSPWLATADRRGGLYLGCSTTFYHYHPEDGALRIGRDNGILTDGVTALYLDREANLWIGTERGASKLISRRFGRYARPQGLYDDEVTAVLERASGEIVLGHRGGLSILSGSEDVRASPLIEQTGGRVDRIGGLAEDRRGGLWLAAGRLGLARIDPGGRRLWYREAEGLGASVNSVHVDSADRLWAASEDGVYRFGGGTFTRLLGNAPTGVVRRLFEDRGGGILAAAASGLYRFAEGGWRSWSCHEQATCNSVFAILEEPDGSYLVGTSAGLHRAAAGGMMRVTAPRIDRPIYFLVRDGAGRTWFGTDDGVLRWDGSKLEHFTVEDGLAGRETYRAAGLVDSRGRVWIGTERGVTVYSEKRPGPPRAPPIVTLTGIDVSGRLLPAHVARRLEHDQNDLIFRFRAVSLFDEERIRIRSRLEGLDSDWRPHQRSFGREIRYPNLAPGRYVLHLKAANAESAWSQPVSSAEVVITRPFWQRTWFFVVASVLMAAALYAASSHQSQLKYSRRLEDEVAERVAQLETEKERLALTLRNIGDGVVATDAGGKVALLNRRAETITGWSTADAVGKELDRVLRLHEQAPEGNLGARLALPGPEAPNVFEEARAADLVTRRGDRRLVELAGSPILQASGDYTGLVLVIRDVTEKRQLEDELAKGQKLEALGLLAGGIAHDFNNLLTVLLGSLSLIGLGRHVDERTEGHLADAETAVLRARDLTQQLLTFSRGGAPVRKAGSISEVIRDSASFVMSGSNVRCDIELPADLWVVEIDAGQISQVINNLLINANQAMPDGGTVRVIGNNTRQPPPSLPAGKYVAIDVIDHGVGIPKSHQSRVFDPYFSTKQEGRGLGLASAYSIAKNHEGLLTVESRPGEGTVFSLFLPASREPAAGPGADLDTDLTGGGRILIMDDEDAVRHVTGSIVEQLGFQVAYAANGQEAVDRYRRAMAAEEPYDAVIMDLTIPGGMGGQEAIGHLRAIDPAVRAIVMSGYSNDPVLAEYGDYGFCARIGKPFAAYELARVLSKVL